MNITKVLAFLSIYLIWGSTYLLNKIAVGQLEPFMLAGVRFLSASFLMFLIVKVSRKSLKVTLVQLKNAAIAGFLFLAIGNGVVVWALSYVDRGLAEKLIRHSKALGGISRFTFQIDNAGLTHQDLMDTYTLIGEKVKPLVLERL